MLLSDRDILRAIEAREIVIEPFDRNSLGTNSYDVHLGDTLLVYSKTEPKLCADLSFYQAELDCARDNPTEQIQIPEDGLILRPGVLYLGVTTEYTETHRAVPFLDGKSSIGRLGIFIHATAGRGDVGFCNHWTLELSVVQPVRVYAGMPIGQLIYFGVSSPPDVPYDKKQSAKYNRREPRPMPSQMWRNFLK